MVNFSVLNNRFLLCNYAKVYEPIYLKAIERINKAYNGEALKNRDKAFGIKGELLPKDNAVIIVMKEAGREFLEENFKKLLNEEYHKYIKDNPRKDFRKEHFGYRSAKDMININKRS